jgi:SAM-dependent methyltransferase
MNTNLSNLYGDRMRANAYAELEFPRTYYLAFRDLPELIGRHVRGRKAFDFGCGAGRSTRFLEQLGFDVEGADISEAMLVQARERDPQGHYFLMPDGDFSGFAAGAYDLVLAAFPFDNIATMDRKVGLLESLRKLLKPEGRLVNLVSTPELYRHEWASFSTRDYPGNREARSGDEVLIVMLDVEDRRPVEDTLCTDSDYVAAYARAGLALLETHRPLGRTNEAHAWVSETAVAPWALYVLGPAAPAV